MSDEQVISIDPSFFQGLTIKQKTIFEQLLQQNTFLRDSIVNAEESATDRVATLNAELEDADNSIDKLEAQVAHLRVEVSRLQVQKEDLMEVVDTATESAKMSMMREVQVNKDAENMLKENVEAMDSRVSQAEFNIEQKYTNLLYEIQDEKGTVENRLKEVEIELNSTLVIVEHKTEANASLIKQVRHLEETKAELEEDIQDLQKEKNSDIITELKYDLQQSLERNTEFKDAVARIKWRSKEEIDAANAVVSELKQTLLSVQHEQEMVSSELVRVMEERDSLEAEIEDARLNDSVDVSDLESLSESTVDGPSSLSHLNIRSPRPLSVSKTLKLAASPRPRPYPSDRSTAFSLDGGGGGPGNQSPSYQGPSSIPLDEHKAKLAEKQISLEDAKRKHFILMEEMENLRKQHAELSENNMLERKNREKLLKTAQKEAVIVQKEYKQCQKYAASVEKELSEYLLFHKRQTEIKDSTITVHKELAKSRAANADLAKQLVISNKTESATQQLNVDLQDEVALLLAEVGSLHNELDANPAKSGKWAGQSDSDDTDSSEDEEDENSLFNNSFGQSYRSSPDKKGGSKNKPPLGRMSTSSSSSSSSSASASSTADYDTLKQMYLASALDSMDKQRRQSASPSPSMHSVNSRDSRASKTKPKLRPRQANTNLNDHYSPSKTSRFSN